MPGRKKRSGDHHRPEEDTFLKGGERGFFFRGNHIFRAFIFFRPHLLSRGTASVVVFVDVSCVVLVSSSLVTLERDYWFGGD